MRRAHLSACVLVLARVPLLGAGRQRLTWAHNGLGGLELGCLTQICLCSEPLG